LQRNREEDIGMKRWDLRILVLLIIGIMVLAGCEDKIKPGESTVERQVIKGVVTDVVEPEEVVEFYETSGSVKAVNTSLVSSKVMGTVREIYVKVGDRVKKGQVLLKIHSPEIEAKVSAAEEALQEARRLLGKAEAEKRLMEVTYSRYERLYKERAISEQEFDEVKTRKTAAELEYERVLSFLKRAEASLKEALAYRGYTTITAPADGTVADRRIDIGSMALPGTPLFIVEEERYRVEAEVDERVLRNIKEGMDVELEIPSLNIKTRGKVSEIVQQIDPLTRTFLVKVDIPEGIKSLRGGLYAAVRIPVGSRERIMVPLSALFERGELEGVYVVDSEGVVTLRLVKTGKRIGNTIEILSGLEAGERIITEGVERVVDGGRLSG
jgi:RND family efflux transporter MFP subunit